MVSVARNTGQQAANNISMSKPMAADTTTNASPQNNDNSNNNTDQREGAQVQQQQQQQQQQRNASTSVRTASSCEVCSTAKPVVYCYNDNAYMCRACDLAIHTANKVARGHARQYLCENCECRPARIFCKTDGVVLCDKCDSDIHDANVVARRHVRIPLDTFTQETLDAKAREMAAENNAPGPKPMHVAPATSELSGAAVPSSGDPNNANTPPASGQSPLLQMTHEKPPHNSALTSVPYTPFGTSNLAASASFAEVEEHRRVTNELFQDMLVTLGSGPLGLDDPIPGLDVDDTLPPLFFEALGGTTIFPQEMGQPLVELPSPSMSDGAGAAATAQHAMRPNVAAQQQHRMMGMPSVPANRAVSTDGGASGSGGYNSHNSDSASAGDALVPLSMGYDEEIMHQQVPMQQLHQQQQQQPPPPAVRPPGRASFGEWYSWAKKAEQNSNAAPQPGYAITSTAYNPQQAQQMAQRQPQAAAAAAAPATTTTTTTSMQQQQQQQQWPGGTAMLGGMMPPMSLLMSTRKDKVARYIEKRRRRVFEKTVRYASRKAYAESRPRIKGRFARRDEIAPDGTILPAVLFKEGLISEEEMKLMEDVAKEKHGTMANGGVRTGRTVQPTELPMNLPRKRGTTLPDLPPAGAAGGEAA